MKRAGFLAALLPAVLLAACSPAPQPARPALWQVEGPRGERAWLLGTIHALDRPALWRSAAVEKALAGSDRIVVEVSALGDGNAMAATFTRLATTPGLPRLSRRIDPALAKPLAALLAKAGFREESFARTETWAAALMLARAGASGRESKYGVDRAVIEAADGRGVLELEGAAGQLGIFDALAEREQRDLLETVVRDAGALETETADLAEAWRKGDMAAIERETRRGLLADPELRAALFTARNRQWTTRIAALMAAREKPFVAVGAAHMAGPDGLPALLAARGYVVTRVQ